MSAQHPSQAYTAWCRVIHNPPDPPELAEGAWGILAVESDPFGPGSYLLTLHPSINKIDQHIDGAFTPTQPGGFGLVFNGELNFYPNKIFLLRFEAYPTNAPKDGPFTVALSNLK